MELKYHVTYKNVDNIFFRQPQDFDQILLDTNDNCNLNCVYCHNLKSLKSISEKDFINFLNFQVNSVKDFQVGCGVEPTMDRRMVDFIKIISLSHAKPRGVFRLQTNGTLLHLHNINYLLEFGINQFSISIDTIDPNVHKELRKGSDLQQILKNIKLLRGVHVNFVTTVTSKNLYLLEDLIKYAISNGTYSIQLRKMFYFQNSKIIKDHQKMKELFITNEQFNRVANELRDRYESQINFCVNDEKRLNDSNANVIRT